MFNGHELSLQVYSEADYIPLVESFSCFLDVSRDQFKENIPLNQFINRLINTNHETFTDSFAAFKESLPQNLLRGDVFTHDCLLGTYNSSQFTRGLRDELTILKDIELDASPLASQYLNYTEGDRDVEELKSEEQWLGAFDSQYPLTKGQAEVLRKLGKDDDLLAVQGGPGTGKTTLFLSIIANRIVDRALGIAKHGKDHNNLMMIVSTSNKAVDNVTERFLLDDEFKSLNHFYFIGGKRDNITASLERVKCFVEELKNMDFDKKAYNSLKCDLLSTAHDIGKHCIDYQALTRNYQTVFAKGCERFGPDNWSGRVVLKRDTFFAQVSGLGCPTHLLRMDKLAGWLSEQGRAVQLFQDKLVANQKKYPRVTFESFKQDDPQIEEAITGLEEMTITFRQIPFWQFELFFKKRTIMFSVWLSRFSEIAKMFDHKYYDFSYSDVPNILTGLSSLKRDLVNLFDIMPPSKIFNADIKELLRLRSEIETDFIDVQTIQKELDEAKAKLAKYETPTFSDYFRKQTVKEHRKIYEQSSQFLLLEMAKRKKELIATLKGWIDILSGNKSRSVTKQWREKGLQKQFELLSLAYPVITSTLSSYNNFFQDFMYSFVGKNGKNIVVNPLDAIKPVHLVLSDESGMCAVHPIFPLLYKSEKAIVVGDPLQLEPIVPVGSVQAELYEDENYSTVEQSEKYSPINVTAYHRAAGCKTGACDDIGEGIVLDEHRRCQSDIADLFIDVANYSGLHVETMPLQGENLDRLNRFGGKNLVFYDVDGQRGPWRNTNVDEVQAIGRILTQLAEAGYDLSQDVGIITPYAFQERLLIKKFGAQLGHRFGDAKIGTVHKFQGVEFDVIIFSSVIFSSQHSAWFLNAKPNLLNVAISRAKHLFISCGNYQKLFNAGGYLKTLCTHMKEYGYLLEGTPDDEPKEESQGVDYLDTCAHLQYFEDVLQSAQEELIIISPWLGVEQNHIQQLENIQIARKRGVAVKVYYGWKQGDSDVSAIRQYQDVLGNQLVRIPRSTHEKCIITDRKELAIGSFNWLSHRYSYYCNQDDRAWRKAVIRRESSVVIRDEIIIEKVLTGLA